jgi:hypothetical protein
MESLDKDGFVVGRKKLPEWLIRRCEVEIGKLALNKLAANNIKLKSIKKCEISLNESHEEFCFHIVDVFSDMEEKHPELFYQTTLGIGALTSYIAICHSEFILKTLTNAFSEEELLNSTMGSIFFNKKSVSRLQYKWHQESSYFPDNSRGLHLWFPLFKDITSETGPMLIAVGSHKKQFPYNYKKQDGGLTQLEIDKALLDDYSIYEANLNRGDVILFDHNAAHCTKPQESKTPRISGIGRYVVTDGSNEFSPHIVALDTSRNTDTHRKIKKSAIS